MKKMKLSISIVIMLCFPFVSDAQSEIDDMFKKIQNTNDIKISVTDNFSEFGKTKIMDIYVGQGQQGIFEYIKSAFERERDNAYLIGTRFNPISSDNTNNIWRIQRGLDEDLLVGQKKNSNYLIMCFNDPQTADYRTVYSAEWWETRDPNYYEGRLIYSYGKKPELRKRREISFALPEGLSMDSLLINRNTLDCIDTDSIFSHYFSNFPDNNFGDKNLKLFRLPRQMISSSVAENISVNEDLNSWANKAIQHINKLSPSEWLRLFGLITEDLRQNCKENRNRDLIVAAGLVLDLCKNVPSKLDEDERELCCHRLRKIADSLKNENEYVHDILIVSANKLEH